jgi:hypothetical protein
VASVSVESAASGAISGRPPAGYGRGRVHRRPLDSRSFAGLPVVRMQASSDDTPKSCQSSAGFLVNLRCISTVVLVPDVQFSFAMSTECPIGHRSETSKDDGRRLGPVTRPEGLMSKKSGRNGRNSQRRNARRGRAKVAATGESLPKLVGGVGSSLSRQYEFACETKYCA